MILDFPGLLTTLLMSISFMYFHVLYSTIQRHDPSLPRCPRLPALRGLLKSRLKSQAMENSAFYRSISWNMLELCHYELLLI